MVAVRLQDLVFARHLSGQDAVAILWPHGISRVQLFRIAYYWYRRRTIAESARKEGSRLQGKDGRSSLS